jgi:methylaspartate mutase epsilon subunit
VFALRRLCTELLSDVDWHVVVYAYMGLFPETPRGALRLLAEAAELAKVTGAERLIVKTVAESQRIPTIAENVAALTHAAEAGRTVPEASTVDPLADSETYAEARALIDAVLDTGPDIDRALLHSVKCGYLDVPYCTHPDNLGRTRGYVDGDGRLRWADIGLLPLGHLVPRRGPDTMTSAGLMDALGYVRRKFDLGTSRGR